MYMYLIIGATIPCIIGSFPQLDDVSLWRIIVLPQLGSFLRLPAVTPNWVTVCGSLQGKDPLGPLKIEQGPN